MPEKPNCRVCKDTGRYTIVERDGRGRLRDYIVWEAGACHNPDCPAVRAARARFAKEHKIVLGV